DRVAGAAEARRLLPFRREAGRGQTDSGGDDPEGTRFSPCLASPGSDRAPGAELRWEPQDLADAPQEETVGPRGAVPAGAGTDGQARNQRGNPGFPESPETRASPRPYALSARAGSAPGWEHPAGQGRVEGGNL